MTYKPDIADQRESPSVPLAEHDVAALAGRAQLFFDTRGVTTGPEARRL